MTNIIFNSETAGDSIKVRRSEKHLLLSLLGNRLEEVLVLLADDMIVYPKNPK